jgi:FAD-dependent oxidoreductase domain-containing protein 1
MLANESSFFSSALIRVPLGFLILNERENAILFPLEEMKASFLGLILVRDHGRRNGCGHKFMEARSYDVIVAGGAVMGSSTAYHLLKLAPHLRVAVVERDPAYTRASTALSLGGVRIQFGLKENILISLYAQDFFSRFEEDMAVEGEKPAIDYRRAGYLFLIHGPGKAAAVNGMDLQRSVGCQVDWWTPERIKKEFPLFVVDDFVGGTFGPRDGYLDPYGVLMGFRKKAISMGACYLADEAVEVRQAGGKVSGVGLSSGRVLHSEFVVNAAGPWGAEVARMAGIELPLSPVNRQVFAVKPEVSLDRALPLVIAPSGLYFRSETGGLILVGRSMEEDETGFGFRWDWKRFTDWLWPELARIIPAFEKLKLVRGWAGLYEVNLLDSNAILGPWPEMEGFYLINGFSGHGLQQSPAAGRYLAELILKRTPVLDLSRFSPRRILENRPLGEGAVV